MDIYALSTAWKGVIKVAGERGAFLEVENALALIAGANEVAVSAYRINVGENISWHCWL